MGIEEEENKKPRTRRELEEDHTPFWIKIFGGSILSFAFLCIITLTGYIVANISSIQNQVNCLNADMITKKEFSDRQKSIMDSMKIDNDNIVSLKEKINAIENLSKERQSWMEKIETKIGDQNKVVELLNKEIAAHKERTNGMEFQLIQLREENRQLQKDIQILREKVASIEGKSSGSDKKE